ncbi:uncharacterized protein FIBRA_05875 [Fibroporia radiculosa]|uniref:SUN domain-containing protein n=1 Tax=Fibroporia radiculosa TaxID=599839 RepID=J4H3S0_9APHY|nr:uncharacterized protein FIBRA_05875 [Fibroporia radiculosa]CCM03729.1 predicted protein [Fibroporia radiculosa]
MFSCKLLSVCSIAALCVIQAVAAPSSSNDPFRNIALQKPRRAEPSVCCLTPLEPRDTTSQDDVLLSFEDWKAKRLGEAGDPVPSSSSRGNSRRQGNAGINGDGVLPLASGEVVGTGGPDKTHSTVSNGSQQDIVGANQPDDWLSPHFRIPITDRFNYASMDCSARVHTAHRSAKSPSLILSSKKDRYMLSPCAEQKQFVVVELCEDIMIDTVQLANFEFFSGVFKDFTVSVSKTYTPSEKGWTDAGTYRALNVRGVQSFHLPPTLRDFYRYIRVDFHTHYGNEYYCPVSLLRVYGLTHLEQWKWGEWEAESRARHSSEEANASSEAILVSSQAAHIPAGNSLFNVVDTERGTPQFITKAVIKDTQSSVCDPSSHDLLSDSMHVPTITSQPPAQFSDNSAHHDGLTISSRSGETETMNIDDHNLSHSEISYDGHASTDTPLDASAETLTTSLPASSSTSAIDSQDPSLSDTTTFPTNSTSHHLSRGTTRASSVSSPSLPSQYPSHPAPPPVTGGESIYRTIMNRLTALEANTTLYARYVEEQTAGVRELLTRLGEDIGRLEGIGKAQAQMYQRSIRDFDRQRRRLENEHRELLAKVGHLTDEVLLEKRLGIAQLCLLLAVLVFLALTRGSRGEHYRVPALGRPLTMRDWGRRTLSLSGDWVNRFRSRSPSTQSITSRTARPLKSTTTEKVEFPSHEVQTDVESPRYKRPHASPSNRKLGVRPRTPSSHRLPASRHFILHNRPVHHGAMHSTPIALPRPVMQRSSSGGMGLGYGSPAAVQKSAKHWARSAHLHEVKNPTTGRSTGDNCVQGIASSSRTELGRQSDVDHDLFGPQADVLVKSSQGEQHIHVSRCALPPLCMSGAHDLSTGCVQRRSESDADVSEGDGWVDTDADGSDLELCGTTHDA